MTDEFNKPYLIIPHLVHQPTWGGSYIALYKNIQDKELANLKIGQSYELFGGSILSLSSSTSDKQFQQDLISHNKNGLSLEENITLQQLIDQNPKQVLGPSFLTSSMPLLVKFTQARGNSFQIHVKKSQNHPHWKPKPESWYYLEDGAITYGIKRGINLDAYKKTCLAVEEKMKEFSARVKNGYSYKKAQEEIKQYISSVNPWQFVNLHKVKKGSIIDLSPGAIQHSWEEDSVTNPLGNVLYEIQLDVTDDDSTIRSFDKGKMQPDGSIRPIHINDYFLYLDARPENNDLSLAVKKRDGQNLLKTHYYSLDSLTIQGETVQETGRSFAHLFVTEGEVSVETQSHTLLVEKGYSCFIPYSVGRFILSPSKEKAIILKTYI